jgi:type IV secretory pathway VirB2 component (pilin)
MRLAFLTAALSATFVIGVLAMIAIWGVSALTGARDVWRWAVPVVGLLAVAFGTATYLGERIAHRRTLARMRAKGEPWAFREE